ncbi:MAG: DUF4338 domain-containing protein [Verrucomicrobia bacterium]|nr:DUF4338 domain-containing protein [Verrucomicrobiota bacterium]
MLNFCRCICFARRDATQSIQFIGPGRNRGVGSNHGAADSFRGASPVGPVGQPEHHYLKNALLVGEPLRYVVEYQGQWLGLLGWSAAAYNIRARDLLAKVDVN